MSAIAGNQYYQGIVSEINSTRVTANLVGPLNGGPAQVTFIGYSPLEFSICNPMEYFSIMTTPDTASTVTANQLRIPVGLLPVMCQIVKNGAFPLATTSTVTIGMSSVPNGSAGVPEILNAASGASVNTGTFGTADSTSNYTRGIGTYVCLTNLGAAQTTGKFKVAIICNAILV